MYAVENTVTIFYLALSIWFSFLKLQTNILHILVTLKTPGINAATYLHEVVLLPAEKLLFSTYRKTLLEYLNQQQIFVLMLIYGY